MTRPKYSPSDLPSSPGVYLMKNANGRVLYVGKAVNLCSRVQSYFRSSSKLEPDKRIMVSKVASIDHVITSTETEALILEANLIKKYRPPYNVVLKDDKNYLYIKIDATIPFPKIYSTRRLTKNGAHYFGPFTNSGTVRHTLQITRKLFKYRTCNLDLSRQDYPRTCLYYDLGRCSAPCTGAISKNDYQQSIDTAKDFLQGKRKEIIIQLANEMKAASHKQDYEQASIIRNQLRGIEQISIRQNMLIAKKVNQDIVSLYRAGSRTSVNVFLVREGKLLDKLNFILQHPSGQSESTILQSFLEQFYSLSPNPPKEIVLPFQVPNTRALTNLLKNSVKFSIPKRGRKVQLIKLGNLNAKQDLARQRLTWEKENFKAKQALDNLAEALPVRNKLKRIEAYDISNIQGTSAVGSMVVFVDGAPAKAHYRRFQIKSISRPDDVGMMRELLSRRFKRMTSTQDKHRWPKPDLIILDGGKGQLNIGVDVLKGLDIIIPLVALAKREEELYSPHRSRPIKLPLGSQELFLVQRLRDEAHRFALSYHQKIRRRKSTASVLDSIPGIGPKRRKALIKHFGSIQKMKLASKDKLAQVVGKRMAKTISNSL